MRIGADLGGLHALEEILEDLGAHEGADDFGAADRKLLEAGKTHHRAHRGHRGRRVRLGWGPGRIVATEFLEILDQFCQRKAVADGEGAGGQFRCQVIIEQSASVDIGASAFYNGG